VHTGMVSADSLQLISDERAAAKLCRSFSASNSLSSKILPLTPLDPRFWQIRPIPGQRNPNKSKILQIQKKKNREIQFAPLSPASLRVLGVLCGLSLASQ
jgi:hypothetical protein